MAPLTDPVRHAAYTGALRNWNFAGFVRFELSTAAYAWIRRELADITLTEIARLMDAYVAGGGEIDEVKETRPEWRDHEFHYDLRFPIQGKSVYIETRLEYRIPLVDDDSGVVVVNIHAP